MNPDIQQVIFGMNAEVLFELGNRYYNGQGVTQDYTKAVECFTEAANQGHVGAQHNLGICNQIGHGVTKNYTKAVEWFTKAATRGNANAQYSLGMCYHNVHVLANTNAFTTTLPCCPGIE